MAKWHHDTSRELDPHLHTHCLIMNCTQGPDGKWRTISNKAFYQNKILLGQIYRNELAIECRKLGYEIELHPKELFEIKGYTREQIEGFSKRHEQIKNKLIEMGVELTTENKIWAWRKTRAKKNHEIGRDEKLPYWHEEADLYNIAHPIPQQVSETTTQEQIALEIGIAVAAGIEHCSERQVAFNGEDIEKFVTAEVKPFSISQLEQAITEHPELIKTFDGRYTTQSALATELATIKLMQQGKGRVKQIATSEAVESCLENKKLTLGQKEAISLTATTSDQFIAWQGVAGAGKTYALNEVKQIAAALQDVASGYAIKGFAPSAEAAKVLGEELGIEANTVARLLVSQQSEQVQPNQIWIVDEAGLLSAKSAHLLLQRAVEDGARVILVGDTRQLSAIEAGNPFKSLQSAGIATAHLNESLRQKPPELQLAVTLAAAGQMGAAIDHLQQLNRIEEVKDAWERTNRIAADYIDLSPEERQQTLIVAGTHKERSAIAHQIRTALKQEGKIGYSVKATQLRAIQNLSSVQTRYTHNYTIDDVVVPVRDYKRLGLYKSQPYTVVAISRDRLHLQDLAGNSLSVDPMKFRKTLYKQEKVEVAVGDVFRWTRNDKELGRRNGQEFTVTGIEGQTATIESSDGKTNTIDLYGPLHLDYALVSTTYSSQGKTADRVLVSSTVDGTVSQESVYVAISRAKYDLKIYAEDMEFLLEQAGESKAQETVLELLQPQAKARVAAEPVATVSQKVEVSAEAVGTLNLRQEKPRTSIKHPAKQPKEQGKAKLKVRPVPTKEPPKQLEVFWTPICDAYGGSRSDHRFSPPHIEEKHWQELVEGSAIHPDIAALNFRSLQMGSIEQEHQAWEYLMYSDKLERTNTGQLTTGMLRRYAHIESGGWWCDSGVNAVSFPNLELQTKPQEKIWGCYKPNEPRANPDKPGKKIKYEHPPKTDLGIFLLKVPDSIAERIYKKAGIEPSQEERTRGFWYCVWKYNLPVIMTEGAKKAASLLSQGHAAIGLPGIYAGYRSKDEQGNPIKAHLHEELAVFATLGREITFCFDYETRPETKRNIEIAISRTGSLLQQQGAKVSVVSLPGPEKGVDDLIVALSPLAYEQAAIAALPLRQWREHNKQERHLTIVPPKKLSVQERKEQLKDSLLGQQPANHQNLNQSPEQFSHDHIDGRQVNQEPTTDTADRRHNSINESRQLDSQYRGSESSKHQLDPEHRTVESAERTSLAGLQGTEDVHSPTVERQSLGGEANAQRLHRSVQGSAGETEVGQTERNTPGTRDINEQSLAQTRRHKPGTSPSQRAGDGSLRGNYQPQETTSNQRTEIIESDQWTTALNDLAQVVKSVNEQQILGNSELNHKLTALTRKIKNLTPQSGQYEFAGLSELAQALTEQQLEVNLVKGLALLGQQIQVVDGEIAQSREFASTLIAELQPEIENLALAIKYWQFETEIKQAIAEVSEVIQQLGDKHTFDFGGLHHLLNEVTTEQVLMQEGLDVRLASLAQQLTSLTAKAPTQFEDMSALVENLQSVQAKSQLIETGLIEKVNVIAKLVADFHPNIDQYKFEGNEALHELALAVGASNIEQQLQEGGLLEQLQQTTSRAISATSQHIKHSKEDLSMLKTINKTKAFKQPNTKVTSQTEVVATLAQQLREIPLDEIANRLGLVLDKYDKHKWWCEGQIISINDQKFYDHLNLKGGYGAIDLVMHVQGSDFKEALQWLADGISELPLAPRDNSLLKEILE